jgi:hypothetical protein
MGVVWYRLRADVRVRWRTLALIAVLVGVGGGVALTAFAGARRTAAAVPQMLAYSRPDDGGVEPHAFGAREEAAEILCILDHDGTRTHLGQATPSPRPAPRKPNRPGTPPGRVRRH